MPSTILLQYFATINSMDDLKRAIEDRKVSVLRQLLKPHDNDVRTSIYLPINLKQIYKKIRKKMYGKILGKDVILYFRRQEPIAIDPSEEYELILEMDPNILEKMKLRKFSVIDRFLWTHIVLKGYYYLYDEFRDLIRKYNEKLDAFSNESYRVSYKFAKEVDRSKLSVHTYEFCEKCDIYHPEQLDGIISTLPLLSKTGVFQFSFMVALNDKEFVDNLDLELGDRFVEDNKAKIDEFCDIYRNKLGYFIEKVEEILKGVDDCTEWLESKIKEKGKITLNDLVTYANLGLFSYPELLGALNSLIKRRVVVPDPEKPEVFVYNIKIK